MTQIVSDISEIRAVLQSPRQAGKRIALVPTMGGLHQGHLYLVELARSLAEVVVVSIYVNPTQFGVNEDFAQYPRMLEQDVAKLSGPSVNFVFAPKDSQMYPHGFGNHAQVLIPKVSDKLCGLSRPHHFGGVATVVTKLFNIISPHLAIFGEKDFQQLMLVKALCEELCYPIEIIGAPTQRDERGLALSSRNQYLTQEEYAKAPALYQALCETRTWLASGGIKNFACHTEEMKKKLNAQGFDCEYYEIVRQSDLEPPDAQDKQLVVLAAARLGKTRLIDNIKVG